MRKKVKILKLVLVGSLLFMMSCTKDDVSEIKYTGTLVVLQKDAYSTVAGRSSDLWPPHTTTVFKWEKDSVVQLNHGTAPDAVDSAGTPFLVETKAYVFTGTESQMKELQATYEEAILDDEDHKFLGLANSGEELEDTYISDVRDYIADDVNGIPDDGDISKDELIGLYDAGKYKEFLSHLSSFSWTHNDWIAALNAVLKNILSESGEQWLNYHVCNDDADLQVRLIKNFITTGEIEMPIKVHDGPMLYYIPE